MGHSSAGGTVLGSHFFTNRRLFTIKTLRFVKADHLAAPALWNILPANIISIYTNFANFLWKRLKHICITSCLLLCVLHYHSQHANFMVYRNDDNYITN